MVDVELYGGYWGYLSHLRALAAHALGAFRAFRDIEWSKVDRLVFVCKGNICRSPYASAKARSLGVPSVSFGLEASDGAPADSAAARNARARGVDLTDHRSTRVDPSCIGRSDLLVAFEPEQLRAWQRRCADRALGVTLVGIWKRPIRPHVQDPYGRSDRYFQNCFSIIDTQVCELARRFFEWHQPAIPIGRSTQKSRP